MSNLSGGGNSQGGVMTLVTTGPDGAPVDEASQQSTLSNASAGTYNQQITLSYTLIETILLTYPDFAHIPSFFFVRKKMQLVQPSRYLKVSSGLPM